MKGSTSHVLFALAACLSSLASCVSQDLRSMTMVELRDRIKGGWAGQMIGVTFGAPTEFRYLQQLVPLRSLPKWKPEMVAGALNQDDLYVEMTFAEVLDRRGLDATTDDFGAMFKESRYALWHANLAARRALRRGVPATLSGTPAHNAHAHDIDFQIEADFIGLMSPGLPQVATEYSKRVGRIMNHGDGICGGIFVAGMYAAAFFERNPRRVVAAGLACLPPTSSYAKLIADTLKWSRAHPDDWQRVWHLIGKKWDGDEPCPGGALRPFNIDAKINGAYIALGLLHGGGDFERTLQIATRCGQDSDCNPSNACGILGVILGYSQIPAGFKSGIPALGERKFKFTSFSFPGIVESTVKRAVSLVTRHGGRREGEVLLVRVQPPKPATLDLWDDHTRPVERISSGDARWSWEGEWRQRRWRHRGAPSTTKTAAEKGAEAEISFTGKGAVLTGPLLPTGGKAEIVLDGKRHRVIDVHPGEARRKGAEALWHAFGLAPGTHTLRILVLGEPYGTAKGTDIAITDLIVFR